VGFTATAGHYNEVDLFFFDQLENFSGRFSDTDMPYVEGTGIEKFLTDFVQARMRGLFFPFLHFLNIGGIIVAV
jgi:hypothetical protein